MSKRLKNWFVVTLLLLAVGAHWAILQSAAYVGMVVCYSKEASLKDAVAKTLDGRHPCKLCKFVKEGKKAERHSRQTNADSRIDFFLQVTPAALYPPETVLIYRLSSVNVRAVANLPLLQPPRRGIS